jgi:hypothetical protein
MASHAPSLVITREYLHHAERLSLLPPNPWNRETKATSAAEAKFVTPLDPVIETADGGRLPAVPVEEGVKLNELKSKFDQEISESNASSDIQVAENTLMDGEIRPGKTKTRVRTLLDQISLRSQRPGASLRNAVPRPSTNPLFPPLPLYGPPSPLRKLQFFSYRVSSFFFSLAFLGTIVLGSIFTSLPSMLRHIGMRLAFKNPYARRRFHNLEEKRRKERNDAAHEWKRTKARGGNFSKTMGAHDEEKIHDNKYQPTEGGEDALKCDVGYYARRVGLDVEEFKVQTEDGFIIILWHVYNPLEDSPTLQSRRSPRKPEVFATNPNCSEDMDAKMGSRAINGKRKYPVLLIHGLLQSAGAYCTNDDDSLAFFLCKRYLPCFGHGRFIDILIQRL